MCKSSHFNYNAVNCAFLVFLYDNEVVYDILNIIVWDKTRYLLKDKCETNIMEENKKHLKITFCSVVSYFFK